MVVVGWVDAGQVVCVRPAQKNWGGVYREENNRFILNVTRAEGGLAAWPRAAKSLTPWLLYISFHRPFPSHLLLLLVLRLVWVKVQPMISYKYLMTAAVGRLLSSLLHVHDDDDDGRNPLNALPSSSSPSSFQFFSSSLLLNVHIQSALDRVAPARAQHIVRTTKMQDGWTDNGSIETLYI